MVQVLDKQFEHFLTESQIQLRVTEIASALNALYADKNPLFISILNGSFVFAADLIRKLDIPSEISFVKYASYSGTISSGNARQLLGLAEDIENRHVIIVEDIIDTGITMEQVVYTLNKYRPKSVAIVALLLKPEALKRNLDIDHIGFEIPNEFVVGYGMDYNGYGRNLPEIYKLKVG